MSVIAIAEDDLDIAQPLAKVLERNGYTVKVAGTAGEAIELSNNSDLLVLDLGLPDRDGLEVCRELRARGFDFPIIILSARVEELDLILGLDAGADDYVTKPFSANELLARIRAALRRRQAPSLLAVGQLVLDTANHSVHFAELELQLTPKEFSILEMLMRKSPQVVTREDLLREVWETDWLGGSKTIDMHVSTLRKKLQEAGARHAVITTVRGVGFRCTRP